MVWVSKLKFKSVNASKLENQMLRTTNLGHPTKIYDITNQSFPFFTSALSLCPSPSFYLLKLLKSSCLMLSSIESTFSQINLDTFSDSVYLLRGNLKLLHNYSRIKDSKSIVWLLRQMFLIKVAADQGSLLLRVWMVFSS